MQDVADRAGVSRTTASFVLNERSDMRISEAAAERVRRAARELDYRPNIAARALSTTLRRSIGLLSDQVTTDGWSGELVSGCVAAAAAGDHMLLIGEHGGDAATRAQLLEGLLNRGADGIVLATTSNRVVEVPERSGGRPVVLLNCTDAGERTPAVVLDDEQGARALAEHLLALGHGDDVWLVGELPPDFVGARARRRGLEAALADAGATLAGVVACHWWPESAAEAVTALLASGAPVSALVCLNDRIAFGAYQALGRAGLVVPDDVSVASFDDSPMAVWLDPTLTSVAIPHAELARRALELVIAGDPAPGVRRVPMPLRVRGSTGPPGGAR